MPAPSAPAQVTAEELERLMLAFWSRKFGSPDIEVSVVVRVRGRPAACLVVVPDEAPAEFTPPPSPA
jgi:hypothetical protein